MNIPEANWVLNSKDVARYTMYGFDGDSICSYNFPKLWLSSSSSKSMEKFKNETRTVCKDLPISAEMKNRMGEI